MSKKTWGGIILTLLATLVSLAIAEAGMRWMGFKPNQFNVNSAITGDTKYTFARPDPEIGWINKPGTPLSAEFGNEKMTIEEDGQRLNVSAGLKKRPGQRVVVVGGSFTMGYGVKDEEAFPYLLDAKYPGVEFENYASGGYGTVQSFLSMKRILSSTADKRIPKLVIYGYMSHHKDRNVVARGWAFALTDSRGHTVNPPHALLENGSLVYHPYSVVPVWPLEQDSALVTELHKRWRLWRLGRHNPQRTPATLQVLSDMNDYAKAHGTKLLVVVLHPVDFSLPDVTQDDPIIGLMNQKGIDNVVCRHPDWMALARDYQERQVRKIITKDNDFTSKDKKYAKLMLNGWPGHPSKIWHKHWDECISAYLDEKRLLQ